jgi:6-phosphogluconolactonase (cycloisomerase 2 family)
LASIIGRAHAAGVQSSGQRPDGFGTSLPAGLTAKAVARLIASGRDISLATLIGMKSWPYQKNTFVAIACFAQNKKAYDAMMTSSGGTPLCQNDVLENVYLAVLKFGDSDKLPKVIARSGKPLRIKIPDGHTDLAMPTGRSAVYDRFDFANYKISKDKYAFGIRAHWDEGYAGGGGSFEALILFSISAGHVVNIFSEPVYFEQVLAGNWNEDGSRDHFEYEGKNIVTILPHLTNGFYDLQVKTQGKNWIQDFSWAKNKKRYEPIYPDPRICVQKKIFPLHADQIKLQFIKSSRSIYCINPMTGTPIQIHGPIGNPEYVMNTPSGIVIYGVIQNNGNRNGGISAYRIDGTTGALTPVPGSPFEAGYNPSFFTVNPSRTNAYVVNIGDRNRNGSVSAYRIDGTTGALTPVPGSPFKTEVNPISFKINPSGNFAYVVNSGDGSNRDSGGISAYRIDGTTGALMQVSGSPFASSIHQTAIVINSESTYAYLVKQGSVIKNGRISVYHIDATTGVLKSVQSIPLAAGTNINSQVFIVRHQIGGSFFYIGCQDVNGFNAIMVYRINGNSGALTEIKGSPFVVTDSNTLSRVPP